MSLKYLKVKIKSLAAEAQIIRAEENKLKYWSGRLSNEKAQSEFFGLRRHRVLDVRNEARAALLAYGFCKGRKRSEVEAKIYVNNWGILSPDRFIRARAATIAMKYGDYKLTEEMKLATKGIDYKNRFNYETELLSVFDKWMNT